MGHRELPCQRQVWTGQGASISGPGLFFSCKFYFISGAGKRTNSSPEVNMSCTKHVLVQREIVACPETQPLVISHLHIWGGSPHYARGPPERPGVIMDTFLLRL